ncbi:hypothetical protein QET40_06870 [Akkermansia sp. N21169]|uniref:hypothetical protein n=1 Tax=Akkermansia sp. N21169 TaxID=3040765 RepID=UPI00244EC175|nr:hypothetical protein [Akkermansia sp. N21169]MDH3068837.1 hypothetical protein [Akkermansia sp. N21169]
MIRRLLMGNMFCREEAPTGGGEGGGSAAPPPAGGTPPATPPAGGDGATEVPKLFSGGNDAPPAGGEPPADTGSSDTPPAEGKSLADYLSDPQKLSEFRKQMGIPDAPEAYKFDAPEGLDDSMKALLAKAGVDYGIAPGAMAGLVKDFTAAQAMADAAAEQSYQQDVGKQFKDLQSEWGQDFKAHCDSAAVAAKKLCQMAGVDPSVLSQRGIDDNAALVKVFYKVSELLGEGAMKGLGNEQFRSGMEEARRIESDPTHPLHEAYMNYSHPNHAYANSQYDRLMGIQGFTQ